jgi:hypothetical protein
MSGESPRWSGLLSGALAVLGGVAFLVVAALTAAALVPVDAMPIGIGIWLVAAFVTFRWFSRDVPSQRSWKARLKRAGLFGLTPLVCALAFWLFVRLLFPHANPNTLGGAVARMTMLAPIAFGFGMLTGK